MFNLVSLVLPYFKGDFKANAILPKPLKERNWKAAITELQQVKQTFYHTSRHIYRMLLYVRVGHDLFIVLPQTDIEKYSCLSDWLWSVKVLTA